jgi:WD40 repeat protein
LWGYINAKDIHPTFVLKSLGFVSDFVVVDGVLYAANDEGSVDIFELKTQKLIEQIVLEPLVSTKNKMIPPRIISVDHLDGKTLLVSIGKSGFRNVWTYENFELKQIIDESKKLTIKEARFINQERVMLSTFGAEVILHDTSENYNIYKSHISQSSLGDITFSADKKKMFSSDESGAIRVIDVQTSKIDKIHSSQNVDNVYHVAHANGVTITAGQDRRVGVYQKSQKDYHIKSDFLVYCVGISPSGKIGVYSSGEENYLQLFNTQTKERGDRLIGHQGVVNQIKFISENELFSVGRERNIFYWVI